MRDDLDLTTTWCSSNVSFYCCTEYVNFIQINFHPWCHISIVKNIFKMLDVMDYYTEYNLRCQNQ